MELGKVKKRQDTQTQSSSSSSSSRSSSSSASSSSRGRVRDSVFYDDDRKMGVNEIYSKFNSSSLFKGVSNSIAASVVDSHIRLLQANEEWTVSMDTDGNGEYEEKKILDAVADSFDSELDLYIQDKLEKIIEKYGPNSKNYLSSSALAELKSYGIVVESVGGKNGNCDRVYSFSLVDENDNVLTDANGKKGSIIFADCLVPDGNAQAAEVQLSSILDSMGYDCISKADFIGREDEYWEVLSQIQENINNGLYEGKGNTSSIYGDIKDIVTSVASLWTGNGVIFGDDGSLFGLPGSVSGTYIAGTGTIADGGIPGKGSANGKLEKGTPEANKAYSEYTKKLNKAITQYREENGVEPTGAALRHIESSVQQSLGLTSSDVAALK